MITLEKIPDEYCTDHLLLLVGANPLPNYVAARLLTKPTSKVHLLHTGATGDVAKALRGLIEDQIKTQVMFWQIDTGNGASIRESVKAIVTEFQHTESVGLNYTGGTKAMSVHAYVALTAARKDAVFSYLDAQNLSLRVEYADTMATREINVQFSCKVTLEELMTLHGYGLKTPIRTAAKLPAVVEALAKICTTKDGYHEWRLWLDKTFGRDADMDKADERLRELINNPQLNVIGAQFEQQTNGSLTPETVATMLDTRNFASAATWLNGKWLEEYTLLRLNAITKDLDIENYTISLEAKKGFGKKRSREFELDIAAMRGYQLFAISCRATDRTEQCKEHLLEVVIRAKQLGGDEAKAALVCCSDRPEALQDQINETWFQGDRAHRVRVFGRKHLLDLDMHLQDWFQSANLP